MSKPNAKLGRNDPCPCGSGNKFKRCCGQEAAVSAAASEILHPQEIGALVALIDQGRAGEAEHGALALLKKHPHAPMLWKILGVAQLRQRKDALVALRSTAQLMPDDAEAHANLGAALHDREQWTESLLSLRRALALRPNDVQSMVDAANAMKALGQARDAVPFYQRALQRNPRLAEAHNNLGNAFLELSQYEDAAACFRAALQIMPDDALVHCNLGNALRQLGLLNEALASTQRALALDPSLSVGHNNLGLILAVRGQREQAEESFRQALIFNPNYIEALKNLGSVLPDLGKRREAIALYHRAIDLDPERAESYCNLGNVLFEFRRIEEAADNFRRALALKPDSAFAHVGLGAALRMQGRPVDAQASCQAALAIDPSMVPAIALLGEICADRGRFAEAEEYFRRVIAIDSSFPFAFFSIASNRKMTSQDTDWLQGTEALLTKWLPLRHEISLRYALGKYFDDVKQFDQAFENYQKANELTKRYKIDYDPAALSERVERVIKSFNATFIRQAQSGGHPSQRPVFIVGMPRSGTSLTEQILASHPAVFGAGELAYWQTAFSAYEAAGLENHGGASLIPVMARDYLYQLAALSPDASRVVDKMPQNFINVGLMYSVFPNAKFIHVCRNPIDTCLSIYFQYFSHLHPYANDLNNLAHYYSEYVRITNHWRNVIPESALLEVPYESLLEDQEGWSRRMLDFIGLPWDPKCLAFHQTERIVITLSKWQVRQKIHTASAGRWKNYEKFVGPLRGLIKLSAQ